MVKACGVPGDAMKLDGARLPQSEVGLAGRRWHRTRAPDINSGVGHDGGQWSTAILGEDLESKYLRGLTIPAA